MENIKVYQIGNNYYIFDKLYEYPSYYTFVGKDLINDMRAFISIYKHKLDDNLKEIEYDQFIAKII